MHTAEVDATNLPVLRDVDGTPIPFLSWVQQVTVDEDYGGHALRLHQQGQAIGRDSHLLYVRFARDRETVALRPDLVRVVRVGEVLVSS
jgi:hypothetical protein